MKLNTKQKVALHITVANIKRFNTELKQLK